MTDNTYACTHSFELGTTVRLGLQMLQAIQSVHENHYIHRDIKPSNFVIGRVDTSKVYLIDFGLARRYRSNDGTVRPARTPAGFRGTARYASIHSHKQIELSRRDDLWCLFYLLVEFRLESGLPWRKHKVLASSHPHTPPHPTPHRHRKRTPSAR